MKFARIQKLPVGKRINEKNLTLFIIIMGLVLVTATLMLNSMSQGVQWVSFAHDDSGNEYSLDQQYTLAQVRSAPPVKPSEMLGAEGLLAHVPYVLRVKYKGEGPKIDGYAVKYTLEKGHVSCLNKQTAAHYPSVVKPDKRQYLTEHEMPVRLDHHVAGRALIERSGINEKAVRSVCTLWKTGEPLSISTN